MSERSPRLSGAPPTASDNAAGWREREILDWMRGLTDERELLRRSHRGRPMSAAETNRLSEIESTLDQSWELVRQRRARRATGQNWDDLTQRVTDLVTTYGR